MSQLPPLVLVPDETRLDAKLLIVGEAPWVNEAEKGYPFAGWSGIKLRQLWTHVGLTREQASILNVYQYPRKPESVSEGTMRQWVGHLHQRLAAHTQPQIIVPMGNLALWALTGKSQPPWDRRRSGDPAKSGILKWRGSVLEYAMKPSVTVIPTIHPAALARQPGLERAALHDWARIADELAHPGRTKRERHYHVVTTPQEVEYWADEYIKAGQPLAFDIENPELETTMIGFANSADEAVTVPTTLSYWKEPGDVDKVWTTLRNLLRSPLEKIGQSVTYDMECLIREKGIRPTHVIWDTANMAHCYDPTDKYDLAYLASIYLRVEFWKDEAKDPEEAKKYTSNMAAFYRYNGMDAVYTWELYDVLRKLLEQDGLLEFYRLHYGQLIEPLLDLGLTGLKVDDDQRRLLLAHLMADRFEAQAELQAVAGDDIIANKSVSAVKLKRFLFETLRLPPKFKRRPGKDEKTVTVDEVAIKSLMNKYPAVEPLQQAGEAILKLRFLDAREKYYKESVSLGGRMYSKYSPRTEEGRLSSSASNQRIKDEKGKLKAVGMNGQNIAREIRGLFLAG